MIHRYISYINHKCKKWKFWFQPFKAEALFLPYGLLWPKQHDMDCWHPTVHMWEAGHTETVKWRSPNVKRITLNQQREVIVKSAWSVKGTPGTLSTELKPGIWDCCHFHTDPEHFKTLLHLQDTLRCPQQSHLAGPWWTVSNGIKRVLKTSLNCSGVFHWGRKKTCSWKMNNWR